MDKPDAHERALSAAWRECSAWDGKITPAVLRKAIGAYLREMSDSSSRLIEIIARCEEHVIESELTFKNELLADIRGALASHVTTERDAGRAAIGKEGET